MAEIRTRISLDDAMSSRLGQISNSLNIMIGHMETANATTRQLESSLNRAVSSSIASSFSNMSSNIVESIDRISTSLATSLNEPFGNLTNQMQRVAQNTETMSTNIERALTRISSGANRASESVGIFGRMFRGAFGQYFLAELMSEAVWRVAEALFELPGAVIGLADEYASTQARIGLITSDVKGLSNAIYEASLRSRGSYSQMADTVAKLGLTARNAFKSTEEIVPFVENIQKMFAIGGTGIAQQQASLLQLSQALGSGKLQGDEFRSIAENAPMLEQIISKYMGVTQGELKDLAKDGEITASVMRNAILGATDEIEAKFKNMPRTFGQNMQLLGTIAFNAFTPFWQQLSAIADSPAMNKVFDGFYIGVTLAGQALAGLVNNIRWLSGEISNLYTSWKEFIDPLIIGIGTAVTAFILLEGAIMAVNVATALWSGLQFIGSLIAMIQYLPQAIELIRALGLVQAFTAMTATEMWGAILLPIGIVIGAIFLAVSVINHFAKTSISALGIISAGFFFLGSVIYNIIAVAWNVMVSFAEAIGNMYTNPLNAVYNLFATIWNGVVNLVGRAVNEIISMINSIPGVNIGGGVNYGGLIASYKPVTHSYGSHRMDYARTGKALEGYNLGANVSLEGVLKNISNGLEAMPSDTMAGAGGYGGVAIPPMEGVGSSDKDGKKTKPVKVKGGKLDKDQQITLAEENLQLITDLARKEVILNYQQLTPQVTITMGDIRETADVDMVIDRLETRLTELYDGSL